MEQLAASVGVNVQMKVQPFMDLAATGAEVFDMLLKTVLKFQFLSNGCLQFDKRNQATQILLINEPRSGKVPTVEVLSAILISNSTVDPVIELECIPKMMVLRTLAEPTDPHERGYDPLYSTPTSGSVMVMPRLGEGWLVSHYGKTAVSRPAAGLKGVKEESKVRLLDDVKPGMMAQSVSSKKGFHRYAPETDEEFRRYWLGVHRIRLPEDFGGYARVTFSGRLELTYPACCVAHQWTILPSETRAKPSEVLAQFHALLQQMVGKSAVTVNSAHDLPSTTKLLPRVYPKDEVSRSAADAKNLKAGPSQPYKRTFDDDFKEQKVLNRKKQRTTRSRGQRAKVKRGKGQQVKGKRMK